MNEVLKTIKNRRSVRSYSPKQIGKEDLDLIIEAGIFAPSAVNEQPWHFTVIQNQQQLQRINDVVREELKKSEVPWMRNNGMNPDFKVTYAAPTLIIVSGRKDALAWQADCSFAMENMMLAAESLGIGSVCLGMVKLFLTREDAAAELGIPEGFQPFYGLALGYKANDKSIEAPKRNRDVVNYIL